MDARRRFLLLVPVLALALPAGLPAAGKGRVEFESRTGEVRVRVDGEPFATYVYGDSRILRPYFSHVHEPGGLQVTRSHPPVEGTDPTDHDTMHPGLWLAFGELGSSDFWRNRGRVERAQFAEAPRGGAGSGRFTVLNRYAGTDGRLVCRETCRYTVAVRPQGYLLVADSMFTSDSGDFDFGDQEEMGLGVRVATALSVRQGGRIANSEGQENEKGVWGKPARWCDYGGTLGGRRVGVCLMPHPENFRPSWFHARDYGLVVANPFGRNAFTGGEKSRIVVKQDERFRLRFGVLVYGLPGGRSPDLPAAYEDYVRLPAR
jgi:hypothetical protein